MVFLNKTYQKILSAIPFFYLTGCSSIHNDTRLEIKRLTHQYYIEDNVSKKKLDTYSLILNQTESKQYINMLHQKSTTVSTLMLKDHILYIKIALFNKNVTQKIRQILQKYKKVCGIVLDLRGNQGGLLQEATGLLDLFINQGVLLFRKGRRGQTIYYATKEPIYLHPLTPITVIVDHKSASASEAVAGSLQSHHRATIIGTLTYGKGRIQRLLPLSDGRTLKITISEFYLPNHQKVENRGITPDIIIYGDHIATTSLKESLFLKSAINHDSALLSQYDIPLIIAVKYLQYKSKKL